ncbi:MAG: hypothetical protein CM15mP58_08210 [Burkholderiaceae bacterium]|nr:MAG: hypothetical protein CM15mP58_08210 [Burkholderiaceae bacterium]
MVCVFEHRLFAKDTYLAKENEILLIFDEVAVGFGRLGDMFASTKSGCERILLSFKG